MASPEEGLSGMDGKRSGRWTEQEMEGCVSGAGAQWMGLAGLTVPGLLAASADTDRHGGRGGFGGAKQPKGSTKEGTSLCGEGGKGVSVAGLSTHTPHCS